MKRADSNTGMTILAFHGNFESIAQNIVGNIRFSLIFMCFITNTSLFASSNTDSLINFIEQYSWSDRGLVIDYRDTLVEVFENSEEPYLKLRASNLLAFYYHDECKYDTAIHWYMAGLPFIHQEDRQALFYRHNNLGRCYAHLNRNDKAIASFTLSAEFMDEENHYEHYDLNYAINFFFTRQELIDQAIKYSKYARQHAYTLLDTFLMIEINYQLAYLNDRIMQHDSTIRYLNLTEELLEHYPDSLYTWMVLACRGIAHIQLEDYQIGVQELESSMILGSKIEKYLCCGNQAFLGLGYLALGKNELAKTQFEQAAFDVQESDLDDKRSVYEALYKGYRQLGNKPLALSFLELHQSVKDTLYARQHEAAVAMYEAELKLDAITSKLNTLRHERDNVVLKNRSLRILLNVFFICLLCSISYAIWLRYVLATRARAFKALHQQDLNNSGLQPSEYTTEPLKKSGEMDSILDQIKNEIGDAKLSVAFLAEKHNMSTSKLTRISKRNTGMTPGQLIAFMKVERAKHLLQSTNQTIQEVAYEVDYSDPSYFIKVFKKETGVTPGEWQKKNQAVN